MSACGRERKRVGWGGAGSPCPETRSASLPRGAGPPAPMRAHAPCMRDVGHHTRSVRFRRRDKRASHACACAMYARRGGGREEKSTRVRMRTHVRRGSPHAGREVSQERHHRAWGDEAMGPTRTHTHAVNACAPAMRSAAPHTRHMQCMCAGWDQQGKAVRPQIRNGVVCSGNSNVAPAPRLEPDGHTHTRERTGRHTRTSSYRDG